MKQVFYNLSDRIIIFHAYKHNNIGVTISNIKSLQRISLAAPSAAPPMNFLCASNDLFLIFSSTFWMSGVTYISKDRPLEALSFDIELNHKYQLSTKKLTNTVGGTLSGASGGAANVKTRLQRRAAEG